jgi:hypothetical protein
MWSPSKNPRMIPRRPPHEEKERERLSLPTPKKFLKKSALAKPCFGRAGAGSGLGKLEMPGACTP